ncbi:MAG: hypothetical protein IPL62_15150 [Caulobacteraceae bacterium]|nr:hypothetical protein [Caulobacteraceae bacterium]
MSNNTARHLYLLVSTPEPEVIKPPAPVRKRASGFGLVSAVLISLTMWAGLLWAGAQVFGLLSR